MSRLEELINELCPNGVEYKKLSDVLISIHSGLNPRNNFKLNTGGELYYVTVKEITSGKIIFSEKTDKIDSDAWKVIQNRSKLEIDDVLLSGIGTIGKVAVVDVPIETWNCSESVLLLKPDKTLLLSWFLKYVLESKEIQEHFNGTAVGSTLKGIRIKDLEGLEIPVPPLPIQEEIVRILDNFTELTAELTAELQDRKKQYEYYRDSLLTFNNDIKKVRIKDYFIRLKGTTITAEKMKQIQNYEGNVKIFAGGKTQINAFEKDIPNANITRVPAVLVQSRGLIDFVYYDKPFTFKNEMWAYTCDNVVTLKYLFHVFKNNIDYFRFASSGMGAMPQISLSVTEDYEIFLPSLEIQERIVNVLDNFEKICNDLKIGLPAEIELRQKQYEYYRDLLLTFPENDLCLSKQASKHSYNYDEIKLLQYVYGYVSITIEDLFDTKNGYTPSKDNHEYWNNGTLPWFRLEDINDGGRVLTDSIQHVTDKAVKKSGLFKENSLIITTSATIGEYALIKVPFLCNQRFTVLSLKDKYSDILNPIFGLYYCHILSKYCKDNLNVGNFASVDMIKFYEFKFKIPSLEEQERSVSILDKFYKYCNDISEGLPAEIKYRQQQYEYYRDKLLTFKRIN